ncbi:MAG TPA: DUF4129 domain-containing protein [Streptosporangiaceae bacterium]|nr:DUF4129 domain-containing protein [Streptosporangiaceae bacterium]
MRRLTRVTRGRPADLRRGASVVLLLAAAAVGLRSRAGLSLISRPAGAEASAGHAFLVVFGAIEGLGAVACVALLILVFSGRRKRKPEDGPEIRQDPDLRWWWQVLGLLTALVVVTVPVVLLVLAGRGRRRTPGALLMPGGLPSSHVSSAAGVTAGGSWWLLAGLAAVWVAVMGLALSSLRRLRGPEPQAGGTDPAAGGLAAAMSAGTAALRGHGDHRAAIIACYAAMEQSLSGAGSPPAAADTPAEVLGRAAASGLVRSAAADALTRLFRKARYSDHVMAADDRATALSALAGLWADLGESGALSGPARSGAPESRARPACRSGR